MKLICFLLIKGIIIFQLDVVANYQNLFLFFNQNRYFNERQWIIFFLWKKYILLEELFFYVFFSEIYIFINNIFLKQKIVKTKLKVR